MKKQISYRPQVTRKHYNIAQYDTLERFISYWLQKSLVLKLNRQIKNPNILEIGKGSGFLSNYLKQAGLRIKTFDFAADLKPDYLGSLDYINKIVREKYEIITCFEVLEHLQFENLVSVLKQLSQITRKFLIISVPQRRFYFTFWLKLPIFKPLHKYLGFSLPLSDKFTGQHRWELGCRSSSIRKFKKLLSKNFKIVEEFTHPLMPYQRFFVLKKNNTDNPDCLPAQFIEPISPLLVRALRKIKGCFAIADLGCGDGRLLAALYQEGLLKRAKEIIGVDRSKVRIERFKKLCPFSRAMVADLQHLQQLPKNSFELVILNQVIEHLPDEQRVLQKIAEILKPNGYLYLSTIIKKWYGFWIYWQAGFKLDPTHFQEYRSAQEVTLLFQQCGFEIVECRLMRLAYPLTDLIIRFLIKFGIFEAKPDFYLRRPFLARLRESIKLPVIGYQNLEIIVRFSKCLVSH